jgi:hypothetical protein
MTPMQDECSLLTARFLKKQAENSTPRLGLLINFSFFIALSSVLKYGRLVFKQKYYLCRESVDYKFPSQWCSRHLSSASVISPIL